ncbi:MAG TPA: LPS export ABC transporter periplasmic protein LptC [Methylomirabilota bacterium]|jgi:LPS export ABC transporter protein LptC|nr:LPS export ABC transporter periplasmic protein LptC [Methylomirabilota bacterium]
MRRLSTLFLMCFLAVLVGLSGVVAWRVMGRRPPAPVQQPPQQAEYQIKEVQINETLDGNLRWSLNADQAEVYDQKGITVMRKVVIQLFSREGNWTVTSDEGTLHNDRRDVALTGNVLIRSSDGLEMRTATLGWNNQRRVLWTDDSVEISQKGTTITGLGLAVRMQEETAAIRRNVRVVITDRTKSNLSLFPRSKL